MQEKTIDMLQYIIVSIKTFQFDGICEWFNIFLIEVWLHFASSSLKPDNQLFGFLQQDFLHFRTTWRQVIQTAGKNSIDYDDQDECCSSSNSKRSKIFWFASFWCVEKGFIKFERRRTSLRKWRSRTRCCSQSQRRLHELWEKNKFSGQRCYCTFECAVRWWWWW